MQHLGARQNYLQAEVHTATPQKVHLLLVEAAIKNIHRTKKAWEEERFEAGFESLSQAQDIVSHLLGSVDKESNPDLAGKIASIYLFIFRCLAEGGMSHDPEKLNDALRVLDSERETWRQVCEKFGTTLSGESSARLDLSTDSPATPTSKPPGIKTAAFGRLSGEKSAEPPRDQAKEKPSGGMSWDV